MDMKPPLPSPQTGQLIAELARKVEVARAEPTEPGYLDAAPFVILRDGDGNEFVEVLKERIDPPHRKTGHVKLRDADSFIAYYAMHGNAMPVYATLEPARFLAVLNDHTAEAAGFGDYQAEFKLAHSKEWTVWMKQNGQKFASTEAFALFLEDNGLDVVKPDAAQMMQIALNIRVTGNVTYQQAVRLQDGNIDLAYANLVNAESKSTAGNKMKIPEQFTLELPVFDGLNEPRYKVEARFRFRLHDGTLTLWYELVRPHKTVEQAFRGVWDKIVKATKAQILNGDPT